MIPESIAAICHEANRRYCREIGDNSQRPWEDAPWWQKQSAIAGVGFVMQNPGLPPSAAHENWRKQKEEEGWKYGDQKNEDLKLHPCIVSYDQLPPDQQVKDAIFRSIVLALISTSGENHDQT